jgi:hypothetical protein
MTKNLWLAALSSLLLASSGCDQGDTDLTPDRIDMPRPEVNTQRADIIETDRTDDEADTTTPLKEDAERVAHEFRGEMVLQLERLDVRIAELEARADAQSKETAVRLRARRDELAARIDTANDNVGVTWDQFKQDVKDGFDRLEKDIDDAI